MTPPESPALLSDIPASIWAAVSAAMSGIGSWWLAARTLRASIARDQGKLAAEALAAENAERAKFRAALMDDAAEMRAAVKECEADRDRLWTRLKATEEQILVLKASNEIMERWLAFFKDGETRQTSRRAANDGAGSGHKTDRPP